MKHHLLRKLIGSAISGIALLLAIHVLIATSVGLQSIVWFVNQFVPGIEIGEVQGSIIGPLAIQHAYYHNKNIAVTVNQAIIDWQPRALLQRRMVINDLQANGVVVEIINTETKKKTKKTDYDWLNRLFIKHINLQNVTLKPGDIHLQIQGKFNSDWNLHWQLQLQKATLPPKSATQVVAHKENVLAVLDSLGGNFTASGIIRGKKLTPRLSANLSATNFTIAQAQVAKLQALITTDLANNATSQLVLQASRLQYAGYLFNTVTLQAQGFINPTLAVNWQLAANMPAAQKYAGNIKMQGNVWGDYAAPKLMLNVVATNGQWVTAKFGALKAQLQADFAKEAASELQINLTNLQIKNYRFAPVQLQAILNRQQQTLTVNIAPGLVRYTIEDQVRTLSWQKSAIDIFTQKHDLLLQGKLTLNAQQYIVANLALRHYQPFTPLLPTQPLQGQITLYIQQITPFIEAVPDLQNVRGQLQADLQIHGTYAKPQLIGAIKLLNGQVDVPIVNLQIRDIQITAQGNPQGIINWTGQAKSGQGYLRFTGDTLLDKKDLPTTLNFRGDTIRVSNTDRYVIDASPDLQAKYINKHLTVTGKITIPSAKLSLKGGNGEAIELSKDVVFVGEKKEKPAYDLPISAHIQLILGNAIRLTYEGLKTELRGQLLINDTVTQMPMGTGQIEFYQGEYNYYGQTLTIRKGSRLIFAGEAVDNPVLNVQAVKTVDAVPSTPTTAGDIVPMSTELSSSALLPGQNMKIVVGVSVQGNAHDPQISLFSEPAILNQTDILSYLVLGQPSSQLGAGSAGALFSAASSLNFGGTGQLKSVMQNVQKSVGLDELSIQSSTYLNPASSPLQQQPGQQGNTQVQQNTSVVLGKKISPKLYISYSVGILQALNNLQIRYLLSKYWTLQSTTSSLGNGVDLLYMIERGK